MVSKEVVINKIAITPEAKYDYEIISEGQNLSTKKIKKETEEYIYFHQAAGRLLGCRYFRVKYYDEALDQMLMLFFYKGRRFGIMQIWELAGICLETDWNEELEDSGRIRAWLKTSINPDEDDWVEILREQQDKQNELEE